MREAEAREVQGDAGRLHAHVIGHLLGSVADEGRDTGASRGDDLAELGLRCKEAFFDGDAGELKGRTLGWVVHLRENGLLAERPREVVGQALVALLAREEAGGAMARVQGLAL